MANRLLWRRRFSDRFGFMPPSSERARFLRNVSHENGMLVWNGDPEGFEIDGAYYDPAQVAEAMMLAVAVQERVAQQ